MCDLGHHRSRADHFGFLVDTPQLRALIDETQRLTAAIPDVAARVEALRPAFEALLHADGWLPDSCATPDETSKMGGGIGQYALYRAEDKSLCLFSLVVPVGRRHAGSRSPGLGTGRHLSRPAGRDRLSPAGRWPRSGACGSRGREAPGARTRRVLHAAAADRRHPLRQHDLRHAVDLDSPARQRHRLRLAPQVRAGHRRRHAVPLRLRQRAVPAGV